MKTATKDSMKQIGTLTQRPQFLRVQSAGQKWVSNSVIVMVAPASQAADAPAATVRFGLTVTKKLNKSAVIRNRMRRRLRAAAYDVLPAVSKPGVDYVFIARNNTENVTYDKLCSDMAWCLKRLSCLKTAS